MALGTPVIVRRAGGSIEMLERSFGGLVYEQPEELLPLVDRLVSDPGLHQTLSENLRIAGKDQFSEDRWLDEYFEIIQMYSGVKRP